MKYLFEYVNKNIISKNLKVLLNLKSPEPENKPVIIPEEIKEEVLPPKLTIQNIKKLTEIFQKYF